MGHNTVEGTRGRPEGNWDDAGRGVQWGCCNMPGGWYTFSRSLDDCVMGMAWWLRGVAAAWRAVGLLQHARRMVHVLAELR